MSRNENDAMPGDKPTGTPICEKQLSLVVRGVFWFTWLTARYRRAANLASQIESQRPERN